MTLVTWLVALWMQGLALAILSGYRDGYVRASSNLLKMPLRAGPAERSSEEITDLWIGSHVGVSSPCADDSGEAA